MQARLLASVALGAAIAAGPASAASIAVLSGDSTLTMVDTETWKATGSMDVSGIEGRLLGIDVRPADGMLYGVTDNGWIVTIDTKTGAATQKVELSEKVKGGVVTVDFNPAADRLRIMSSDGTSHRVNVDDGKVTVDGSHKYNDADANKGKTPKVIAGAYSNSVKGTKETTLYNIDASTWTVVRQAPPNDGVLNTIGGLDVKASEPVAFNIVADGNGKNDAWLVTGGALYAVDLQSGKAKSVGTIVNLKGTIRDIAWWPADASKSM